MELTLNTKWLHALRLLAPKNDTRTYLNGVFVDAKNQRHPKLVAMDGCMLGVLDVRGHEADEALQVRIPHEMLKLLPKASDVVLRKVGNGQWEIGYVRFQMPPEGYPDWSRPLPAKCNGEAAHYDPRRLAAFLDVAHALGAPKRPASAAPFELAQNGPSCALVSVPACPEFIGGLMPYRSASANLISATPEWAK